MELENPGYDELYSSSGAWGKVEWLIIQKKSLFKILKRENFFQPDGFVARAKNWFLCYFIFQNFGGVQNGWNVRLFVNSSYNKFH